MISSAPAHIPLIPPVPPPVRAHPKAPGRICTRTLTLSYASFSWNVVKPSKCDSGILGPWGTLAEMLADKSSGSSVRSCRSAKKWNKNIYDSHSWGKWKACEHGFCFVSTFYSPDFPPPNASLQSYCMWKSEAWSFTLGNGVRAGCCRIARLTGTWGYKGLYGVVFMFSPNTGVDWGSCIPMSMAYQHLIGLHTCPSPCQSPNLWKFVP